MPQTKDVIRSILRERDLSQSDLARALDVKPQAVQQWVSGRTRPTGKNLEKLSEYLQLPPATILYGSAQSRASKTVVETDDGFVAIPRFSARGSCGVKEIYNSQTEGFIGLVRATEAWLRAKAPTANLQHLEVITAQGDSMSPTIKNLDFVFVDRTCETVREDGVYTVTYAGRTYIKRIQTQIDGGLLLVSDNPHYPPISVPKDRLDQVVIEGKCVISCSAGEL